MKKVSAVLLAAGKGTRAQAFKPLVSWKNETFISKVYKSLQALKVTGDLQEIVVVTGFQTEKLYEVLHGLEATSVFNSKFETGMHSSILLGLESLKLPWGGALITLVDQPQLDAPDYKFLIDAYQKTSSQLLRPSRGHEFGNPSILSSQFLPEIKKEPDSDRGCAYLFKRHPDDSLALEVENEKYFIDYDTKESSQAISRPTIDGTKN